MEDWVDDVVVATEWCPHCGNEFDFKTTYRELEKRRLKAFCTHCGVEQPMCSMCANINICDQNICSIFDVELIVD